MTSSAQTPEPTDEQIREARRALGITPDVPDNCLRDWEHRNIERVARALAAAVTAEREKYLQVANLLERQERAALDDARSRHGSGKGAAAEMCEAMSDAYGYAARRIREVSR